MQELVADMLHKLVASEQNSYGLWWHGGSSQGCAQLVTCAGMPAAEVYPGLMMNEDLIATTDGPTQAPEVDFMDELLAD